MRPLEFPTDHEYAVFDPISDYLSTNEKDPITLSGRLSAQSLSQVCNNNELCKLYN